MQLVNQNQERVLDIDMDEDNLSSSQFTKKSKNNVIEISDEEDEEVELSPVETIVWDCCEVQQGKEHLFLYRVGDEDKIGMSLEEAGKLLRNHVHKKHGNIPNTHYRWDSVNFLYKVLQDEEYQYNSLIQTIFHDKNFYRRSFNGSGYYKGIITLRYYHK